MFKLKNNIIIAVILCMAYSCSSEQSHIHGHITSLPDQTVYLKVYESSMRTMDSTRSVNGEFQFVLPDIIPNQLYIKFDSSQYYIPIMIDGTGEVSVTGNFNYPQEIEISGTDANRTLNRYRQKVHSLDIMLNAIDIDLKRLGEKETPDTINIKRLNTRREQLLNARNNIQRDFVRSNRGSLVSAMLISSMITDSTNLHTIDSLMGELEPTMRDNTFLQRIMRKKAQASSN